MSVSVKTLYLVEYQDWGSGAWFYAGKVWASSPIQAKFKASHTFGRLGKSYRVFTVQEDK